MTYPQSHSPWGAPVRSIRKAGCANAPRSRAGKKRLDLKPEADSDIWQPNSPQEFVPACGTSSATPVPVAAQRQAELPCATDHPPCSQKRCMVKGWHLPCLGDRTADTGAEAGVGLVRLCFREEIGQSMNTSTGTT